MSFLAASLLRHRMRRWLGRATVLGLAVLLQACASGPDAILARPAPGTPAAQAATVRMLAVSTRAASSDPGQVFNEERGPTTMALLDVSIPPNHQPGQVEAPAGPVADPSREFALTGLRLGDESLVRQWASGWPDSVHLLVFVHGFNNSFASTVLRFAQFTHDAQLGAAPILFAWPSAGRTTSYLYDRESAAYSRDALESLLRQAASQPSVREITVLAHSMGSWLAIESLRQYAIRSGRVDPKIRNVILAAPDLDGEVLSTQLKALGPQRPRLTLLVSQDDRALQVSRFLAGGQRVGLVDPADEPVRKLLEKAADVTVIDLTEIRAGNSVNHAKFIASPAIVRLIGQSLMSGSTLEEPRAGANAKGGLLRLGLPLRNRLWAQPVGDGGVELLER